MKKRKTSILLLATVIITALFYYSCSEDTTTGTSTSTGNLEPYPFINLRVGALYNYNNDSLTATDSIRTDVVTRAAITANIPYFGKNAFRIIGVSFDTFPPPPQIISIDTVYVSSDSVAKKFYQFGITKILDSAEEGSWDVIADFSVPLGQQYQIAIDTAQIGTFGIIANIKGTVIGSTSVNTTSFPPVAILCYRIEIRVDLTTLIGGIPIGTAYVDYYLGYTPQSSPTNPSGLVKLKLRPFTVTGLGPVPGFNQQLQSFIIP
ncbi:MAG: hypothetical protein ACRDFC_05090 [Ignavibacteria bacterium]